MASPEQIAQQQQLMNQPQLANTQQLQKLSPNQLPLQQQVINSAQNQLLQGVPNVPFGPIGQNTNRNFYQNTVPALKEQLIAGGANTGDSAFLSRLSSAGGALQSNLASQEAQHGLQNAQLQQGNLRTLLSQGLNPTVENLYTEPREAGLKAFLGSAAEAAAPAVGKYGVELGAEAIKGAYNKFFGAKGQTTPTNPTSQQVAEFAASPEAQSLAQQGIDKDKIYAALQRPGQQGLTEALNQGLQPTGNNLGGEIASAVAAPVAGYATKKIIDKATSYGAKVTEDAAAKVAEAGLTSGDVAATGASWGTLALKLGLPVAAVAAFATGAWFFLREATDQWGKGPELRKADAIREAAHNEKNSKIIHERDLAKSQADVKAREEAIARGEYANATEYEKAQRAKTGVKEKTHAEQQESINKQIEEIKKKKEEDEKKQKEYEKKKGR